jgi:hypothetical protein
VFVTIDEPPRIRIAAEFVRIAHSRAIQYWDVRCLKSSGARRITSGRPVFSDDFAKRCHRPSMRPRVRDELAQS